MFLSALSSASLSPSKTTPVTQFGCRFIAYMTPDAQKAPNNTFLRQALLKGDNSLMTQSLYTADSGSQTNPMTIEKWVNFLSGGSDEYWKSMTGMQRDGWGLTSYNDAGEAYMSDRSEKPISTDPQFIHSVNTMLKEKPSVVLAHLREGHNPVFNNVQPFSQNNVSFMHNGGVPDAFIKEITPKLKEYHQKYNIPLPKGDRDSEPLFYYLLGQLHEKHGTHDLSKLSSDQIRDVFGKTLQKIVTDVDNKTPNYFKVNQRVQTNSSLNVLPESRIHFPVGLNFVLSDGKRIFASRTGRNLNVGFRTHPDGSNKDTVLASRRFQPKVGSGEPAITWMEVPDKHIITLERNPKEHTVSFRLDPFSAYKS